jgi:hypothetical protein
MLFILENAFVDIVREDVYTGVLTLRSADRSALKALRRYTGANIIRVPDQFYHYVGFVMPLHEVYILCMMAAGVWRVSVWKYVSKKQQQERAAQDLFSFPTIFKNA